jgi:hypothetical protein
MTQKKKAKPTFKKDVVVAPKVLAEPQIEAADKSTSAELVIKIAALLKEAKASGYILGVAGSDSKIIPYAGAGSIGDLLTIKYVVEKEITRLIESSNSVNEGTAASTQQ